MTPQPHPRGPVPPGRTPLTPVGRTLGTSWLPCRILRRPIEASPWLQIWADPTRQLAEAVHGRSDRALRPTAVRMPRLCVVRRFARRTFPSPETDLPSDPT